MNFINDILDIERFTPLGASVEYLKEVDTQIREINSHRPLSEQLLEKLFTQILYDRVHSSAVTEGNRLTRRETIVVLTKGIIEAGNRKDQLEVKNLAEANIYLQEALDADAPLTLQFVKELHRLLLKDLDDKNAGKFRQEEVAISGAKYNPPTFFDVPDLLRKVLELADQKDNFHPVQKAAWMHWAIGRVHPFIDGNGRIARLLQDYILLKNQYVPATIQPDDREKNYYDALESADEGVGRPFLELICKNTLKVADSYLSIIREEQDRNNWLVSIANAAREKVSNSNHRKFLIYQRAIDQLKLEFYRITNELNGQIPDLRFKFAEYGNLPFEKYEEICVKGKTTRSWSFGIEFSIETTILRYIFWHGSHYTDASDVFDKLPSKVILLVSAEQNGMYRLPDEIKEDRVTLREIIPDGTVYLRRRYNPVKKNYEWDKDITQGDIVRDFIQEVLLKLGVI